MKYVAILFVFCLIGCDEERIEVVVSDSKKLNDKEKEILRQAKVEWSLDKARFAITNRDELRAKYRNLSGQYDESYDKFDKTTTYRPLAESSHQQYGYTFRVSPALTIDEGGEIDTFLSLTFTGHESVLTTKVILLSDNGKRWEIDRRSWRDFGQGLVSEGVTAVAPIEKLKNISSGTGIDVRFSGNLNLDWSMSNEQIEVIRSFTEFAETMIEWLKAEEQCNQIPTHFLEALDNEALADK
jgi:hypothetical protein